MKMKLLLLFVIPFFVWSCDHSKDSTSTSNIQEEIDTAKTETTEAASPQYKYGYPLDSFRFHQNTIARNEYLGDILAQHGVTYQTIDKIARASEGEFDVRKIRSGKSYCVVSSDDSVAQCFVYEPNDIEYVVYDFTNKDSISIYQGERPVTTKERTVSGVITSSLYQTMDDLGVTPVLALKLSEIYAWTIDFYRIQKNDRFKVVFEENYVDGKSVGIGHIKAASFHHFGEPYYAFYFDDGETSDYYDEDGNSLRKAFLKSPVKFSTLTSRYNRTRYHPILKRVQPHLGTDYAAPRGTPIRSTGDGVVIKASYTSGNGNYVKVRHNSTYTTQYLHMNGFAKGIREGAKVQQGDVIGYIGSTGLATGPHVCYRFWKNGSQVDPLKEKLPPSKPVPTEHRAEYDSVRNGWMEQLQQINWPESWDDGVTTK